MSVLAEAEHARAKLLDNPESIYRACADMELFNQEILRVILLNTRYRHISTVEITKGSINESLAYPRDVFRPVVSQSAYAFVLVHNHPSGDPAPSEADVRLTRRELGFCRSTCSITSLSVSLSRVDQVISASKKRV
jgi:DNA repair protein RadC